MWFWFGVALGVLLTVPLAALAARRWGNRIRALEQRARSAERLAEMSMLTGGLAHEIKNPLSTLNLNIQLIREDLDDLLPRIAEADQDGVGKVQRRFQALARENQRLKSILEDFLRFAGRIRLDLAPVHVNDLTNELVDFFAPQAQAMQVNLRTQLQASPDLVQADVNLLKQALLNLMINATQAMADARASGLPHGGANELIIRSERGKTLGREEVRIHITDTGPGIPAEQLEKVFQPYFTTKKGGTGLGLPTSRRIIEEHAGTITVHSAPGRGTDFCITLPAASEPRSPAAVAGKPDGSSPGTPPPEAQPPGAREPRKS